jgi:hypothetical protein
MLHGIPCEYDSLSTDNYIPCEYDSLSTDN